MQQLESKVRPYHDYPPVTEQIKNYLHHWRKKCCGNVRKSTWDQFYERLSICNTCESGLDANRFRCFACGCFILKKAFHWDEICPFNKWPIFPVEDSMRLFENSLQNSLVGLTALYIDNDSGRGEDYDVTISANIPLADIFIVTNKESIETHLQDTDNLALVFCPNLYRQEIGGRPFTFYFQPNFDFNPETFFVENTVYSGNCCGSRDIHGHSGGSSPVFAAIKFAHYLGIKQIDFDVLFPGEETDLQTLELRLNDLRKITEKRSFNIGEFSFLP